MKSTKFKTPFWHSMLSIIALAVFAFIAAATIDGTNIQPRKLPDGRYEVAKNYRSGKSTVAIGNMDKYQRFEGPVVITYYDENGDFKGRVNVPMKAGKRHGMAIKTHANGAVEEICYQHGKPVDKEFCEETEKSAVFITNDNSAYSIYSSKNPWFAFQLDAFGFDPDYMKAYLDTVELVLYTNEFTEEEFDDYYDDMIEALEETAFDSIIQLNAELALYNGIDLYLSHEFRLATIYSYGESDGNTYNAVKSIYPNYLLILNTGEVNDSDFEGFCGVYDSIMSSYEPIATDDPFFVDSLDARMYRTLDMIYSIDESSESASQSLKSAWLPDELESVRALQREYVSRNRNQALNKTPQEVAEIVLYSIIIEFIHGDLLKGAVKEAFTIKKGIVQLPSLVTNFSENPSSTSVTLEGNVIEDGGGEVTSRGIAWESFYNPTIDNQVLAGGAGTGVFTVTLTGLSEGETYYARAFATNSAGTAYGNCISFVAGGASGIEARDVDNLDFQIYPNPATDIITLSFEAKDIKGMMFTLYDLSGKIVLQEELANVVQGENTIRIDLPELISGIYTCSLTRDHKTHAIQKLTITR